MYEFGVALRLWREWGGISQERLGKALGAGKSWIGKVEMGVMGSRVKESTKEKYWRYFECGSLKEFLMGPSGTATRNEPIPLPIPPMEVRVPVFSQGGLSPDWSDCGKQLMELHVHAPGRDLIAVLVETNAMYPLVPRGSIAMVDRKITLPEEGKIALFWANNRALIRRFAYAAAAGFASLQALDPEVAPVEVPIGMLICMGMIYRVVADPNG